MASNLKWRAGFGWGTVFLLLASGLSAVAFTGAVRWSAIGVAGLASAYAVYQYQNWNRRGWREVHFRAMLAYSGIAGREHAIARQAGREFDLRGACSQLGLLLCRVDNRSAVDAMLSDLSRAQGGFLAGLVERHAAEVLPGAPIELRREVVVRLGSIHFGPQLIIAWVIENTYGGPEAARYAVAVAAGDAQ